MGAVCQCTVCQSEVVVVCVCVCVRACVRACVCVCVCAVNVSRSGARCVSIVCCHSVVHEDSFCLIGINNTVPTTSRPRTP